MFGIIYTLLGLVAYGKGLIKNGIHDANSAQIATENGATVYIDARGKLREVGTDELVYYPDTDPLTGDSGYTIIEPKSKRLHQFVNLAEPKREAKWKKAHEEYIKNGVVYENGKKITVVDFESKKCILDREGTYWRPYEYKDIKIPTRPCKGHRFKDIETGRIVVKRDLPIGGLDECGQKYKTCEFYMDAETGMILREVDENINAYEYWSKKIEDDSERSKEQNYFAAEINEFMNKFNVKQKQKLEMGLKEHNPKEFYKNLYSTRW